MTKHETSNAQLQDFMDLAAVHPIDKQWRTKWPEKTREAVAVYCAFLHLKASDNPVTVPPMPKVVVRCTFDDTTRHRVRARIRGK